LGTSPRRHRDRHPRQALAVEGNRRDATGLELSKQLRQRGNFQLAYWPRSSVEASAVRQGIQACLQSADRRPEVTGETALLYLQGQIETAAAGEAWLVVGNGVRLSRSWLRQQIQQARVAQQVLILDCPGAGEALADWLEELQLGPERGQCAIAAAAPTETPERFAQAALEALASDAPAEGLSAASWIYRLQVELAETAIEPHIWLSGGQGGIEMLPAAAGISRQTAQSDLGICPYMGLRPFGEDDDRYFFGREALTQTLLAQLHHRAFLAVVGASGSGKSSVVRAGLIAQLRQGQQIPGAIGGGSARFGRAHAR